MASRMDRYSKLDKTSARSKKNKDLYKKVQEIRSRDINDINNINRYNEIDISMNDTKIENRETYKKKKRLRQMIKNSKLNIQLDELSDSDDFKKEENQVPEKVEKKNHDVVLVLSKAKDERGEVDDDNRSLEDLEYTELNSLNLRKQEYSDAKEELLSLVDKGDFNNQNDDVGLLDDLKEDDDTLAIQKVIEQKEDVHNDDTKEMDKTFFTSIYRFKDFDLEDGSPTKKKIIIIIILLLVIAITCFLYFKGIIHFKVHK